MAGLQGSDLRGAAALISDAQAKVAVQQDAIQEVIDALEGGKAAISELNEATGTVIQLTIDNLVQIKSNLDDVAG